MLKQRNNTKKKTMKVKLCMATLKKIEVTV